MARFDVYRHPLARSRRSIPFLLSIQTDALDYLDSRIVVPLVKEKSFGPRVPFLHPTIDIEEDKVVVAMNELVAIERGLLGNPVANLRAHSATIISALDYLVSGY